MKIDTNLVLKSIAYRIISLLITIAITYYVTGNGFAAVSVGFIDSLFKILYYYIFDKMWSRWKKNIPR